MSDELAEDVERFNRAFPFMPIELEISTPGDGSRRYNVADKATGRILFRAVGRREAVKMLAAFRAGVERMEQVHGDIRRGMLLDPMVGA